MAHRKTVDIRTLLNTMNERIRLCLNLEGRQALCLMLESILMDNNVYAGFGYVDAGGEFLSAEEVNTPGWSDNYRHFYYTSIRLSRPKRPHGDK